MWLTTIFGEILPADRLAGFALKPGVPGDGEAGDKDPATVVDATIWALVDAGAGGHVRIAVDILDRETLTASHLLRPLIGTATMTIL